MIVLLFGFLVLLAGANYLRFRDSLYPAFIQSAMWALLALIVLVLEPSYWALRPLTLVVFGAGAFSFSVGCLVVSYGHRPLLTRGHVLTSVPPAWVVRGFVGLSVLLLPIFINRALTIANSGPTDSLAFNLRWMLNEGGETLGAISYAVQVSLAAMFLATLRCYIPGRSRVDLGVLALAVPVAITYSLFTSGRTTLFLLVFLLFVPLVSLRYVKASRAALVGGVLMVTLFVVIGVVLRTSSGAGSFAETVSLSYKSFMHYLIGGMYAFDTLAQAPLKLELGANSLRFFAALLAALGSNIQVKPLVQEFSYPFATNVYTVYQPYYLDFDMYGAVMAMFMIGCFHGFVYRRVSSRRIRSYWLMVFSISMYPLFMQFFQDQYFNLLSTWIQIGLVGGIAFGAERVVRLVPGLSASSSVEVSR